MKGGKRNSEMGCEMYSKCAPVPLGRLYTMFEPVGVRPVAIALS